MHGANVNRHIIVHRPLSLNNRILLPLADGHATRWSGPAAVSNAACNTLLLLLLHCAHQQHIQTDPRSPVNGLLQALLPCGALNPAQGRQLAAANVVAAVVEGAIL